jgi:hypothetical protein
MGFLMFAWHDFWVPCYDFLAAADDSRHLDAPSSSKFSSEGDGVLVYFCATYVFIHAYYSTYIQVGFSSDGSSMV